MKRVVICLFVLRGGAPPLPFRIIMGALNVAFCCCCAEARTSAISSSLGKCVYLSSDDDDDDTAPFESVNDGGADTDAVMLVEAAGGGGGGSREAPAALDRGDGCVAEEVGRTWNWLVLFFIGGFFGGPPLDSPFEAALPGDAGIVITLQTWLVFVKNKNKKITNRNF